MLLPLLKIDTDNFTASINNESLVFIPAAKKLKEYCDAIDSKEGVEENHHFEKVLCLTHLVIHPASIYGDFPLEERIFKAMEATEIDKEIFNSDQVQAFLQEYEEILEKDIELGLINDAYKGVNSLRKYFTNVDFTKVIKEGAQKGKPLYSAKEMSAIIKDMDKMLESISSTKQKFLDLLGKRNNSSTRANRQMTRYESKLNAKQS